MENEIDGKLIYLSKLNVTNELNKKSDKITGISEYQLESTCAEIQILIEKLTVKINEMNENAFKYLNSDAIILHTVNRHYDLLRGYVYELNRLKRNLSLIKESQSLLESSGNIFVPLHSGNIDVKSMEKLSIIRSNRLLDQQLNIAFETRNDLHNQRQSIQKILKKLHSISNRIPLINNVVRHIRTRKTHDTIISLFLVACFSLVVLYYTVY